MARTVAAPQRVAASTQDTKLWHPFAAMGSVRWNETVIARGHDVWVWDDAGNRYLDATASLWYANVGHGRGEIADAIRRQLELIETYSTFGDFANEPAIELASRLSRLAPVSDGRVLFGSGGADAVEAALKLSRLYWQEIGQPQRVHAISRTQSYHGTHGFGTSIAGIESNRAGFGDLIPDVSVVDRNSVEAASREIERVGPDRVASFILEPVIGAGGVYPPPDGYIEGIAELCLDTGIHLIVDSTICGFGRLGTWFGVERWDVTPDMIIFAKGVTSGYLPLGGVVVSGRIAEPFWRQDGPQFRHGQTYTGHATCCAAGLATLDLLERHELLRRGADLEHDLLLTLADFRRDPLVADVRGGLGLLAAIELAPSLVATNPAASAELAKHIRDAGVLVRPLATAVALSPPLTITVHHLSIIAEAIQTGLDALRDSTT